MDKNHANRIYRLRLAPAWRLLFIASSVLSFLMVGDALATGDPFVIGTSLAFFGFGGVVVLKVMLRNSGTLELRADGLLLDCYLCTGFIRWQDLEPPQELRVLGTRYLGLNTRDPQAYRDSRTQLAGLKHDGDRRLGQGVMRVMLVLLNILPPARSACSALLSLFGMAPIPSRTDEASLMEWNRQSYGAQIFIHRMWLPDFERLLRDLQARAQDAVETIPPATSSFPAAEILPLTSAADPASSTKICPMCAEQVQARAKLCRYCRYLFEEERFLPEAS